MSNYLYDIKLGPVGYGAGGIVTNRRMGICRANGGLVSVSISAPTGVSETYSLSHTSNLTFDPTVPGAAGLEGSFLGKYSELIFFRLGTYRRLFTARNSPFGWFGKSVGGFYSITFQPNDAVGIGDPILPGNRLPM
jgi:hypothetical protein